MCGYIDFAQKGGIKNMIRCHFITMLVLAGAAAVSHASNFTVTSSTSGSSARFIVTRDDTTAAETVNYRTVSISAYAGQHYTAKSGTLTFPAGQSAVTNTVTETTPTADAYRFQTGTSRYYRFEITDAGGFLVTNATRTLTTGTRVTASDAFGEKDLPINAGTITVTDGGYDQAYHSGTVNNYFTAAAPKDYLVAAGAQLRATVTFHAREKDDGYQYVAIYANTSTSNVDTGAKDGDPGTVSYSRYMAGFTIDGNVSSTWYPYTFPLTSKGHDCGEQTHPWSGNSNGNLKQQYFKSNCRAADGRLIIPTDLSSLYVRLNASGNLNDTWYASNVVAHVQAVDATVPTPHIEKKSDEVAANLMVSLIRQCTYLLAKQIAQLEEDFKRHGGIKERMYAARSESRAEDWGKVAYSRLAASQSLDELTARYREMTAELRRMADGIKRRKGWV